MRDYLQATVTVVSLINPAICAAMFSQIESGRSRSAQIGDAIKAAFAVLIILSVGALIGAQVLHAFNISLDAFMVAGGAVLAWMGFSMIRGGSPSQPASAEGSEKQEKSLTPLILFAASPGTLTGVITLSVSHSRQEIPIISLVAVAIAVLIMGLVLVLVARFGQGQSKGGLLHDTVSRFMGLIVFAMGVQLALTGAKAFLA